MARRNVGHLDVAVESGPLGLPRPNALRVVAAFPIEACPRHILKEDKRLFIPCVGLFMAAEQESALRESYGFDMRLMNTRYGKMANG